MGEIHSLSSVGAPSKAQEWYVSQTLKPSKRRGIPCGVVDRSDQKATHVCMSAKEE